MSYDLTEAREKLAAATPGEMPWWLRMPHRALTLDSWKQLAKVTDEKSGERGAWAEVLESVEWLLDRIEAQAAEIERLRAALSVEPEGQQ